MWAIRNRGEEFVCFQGDAMMAEKQVGRRPIESFRVERRAESSRGFSWAILRILVLFGLCGSLAAAPYSGGDGTFTTPYLLSTATDLATLAATSADWGKWFLLTADVDMQATPAATPIGTKATPFTGVFDGGGYSIKGLVINDTTATTNPVGLFGVVDTPALIERLRLIAPSVKSAGSGSIGALVGQTIKGATVQQCSVEQGVVSAPSADAAGGLIGNNSGTVRECCSTAAVTALGLVGGLLGRSAGTVENCSAAASVTATKVGTGTASGGLSGASVGGTFGWCLANSPSISGTRTAGLVGYADPDSIFSNCVCNKIVPKAVENWAADASGLAWCEDANNLKSEVFFTGLGWDLKTVWALDLSGVLRLRWTMNGGPMAVIKEPSGAMYTDLVTGLAKVALDGTQSFDPTGATLKYSWQCLTADGGPTNIMIDAVASPSVSLPAGTYRIQLTVSKGSADSLPAAIMITVAAGTVNTPPTAVIQGPTGTVRTDPVTGLAKVAVDGTQSSDPERSSLKYTWRCLTASGTPENVTIDPVASPTVSLRVGTHQIELTVNDGTMDSLPATLTITVVSNAPPTATAKGPSEVVRPDPATGLAKVALDGSQSSDPDKDPLKYQWKCLTAGGGATGVTVDSVACPLLSLPAGAYRIELTVNDGAADSAPVVVFVTINTVPTAKAGDSQVVYDEGNGACQVKLDGSRSSDPEAGKGQTLVYSWVCSTANPGAASGPAPSLVFPVGVHTVTLTVSDGVESSQDTTQVTVQPAAAGARIAASPSTIGRASTVPDVKFYLLLPAGKSVSDVDTQAPINLSRSAVVIQLTRDLTYSHKKQTVVAGTDRQKVLDLAGAMDGSVSVKMSLRLKTGEAVSATINLQITSGFGTSAAQVQADRAFYYLNMSIWQ